MLFSCPIILTEDVISIFSSLYTFLVLLQWPRTAVQCRTGVLTASLLFLVPDLSRKVFNILPLKLPQGELTPQHYCCLQPSKFLGCQSPQAEKRDTDAQAETWSGAGTCLLRVTVGQRSQGHSVSDRQQASATVHPLGCPTASALGLFQKHALHH